MFLSRKDGLNVCVKCIILTGVVWCGRELLVPEDDTFEDSQVLDQRQTWLCSGGRLFMEPGLMIQ